MECVRCFNRPKKSVEKLPCEYWFECNGSIPAGNQFCDTCSFQYSRCRGCGTSGSLGEPLDYTRAVMNKGTFPKLLYYERVNMDSGIFNKWIRDLPPRPIFSFPPS